MDNGVLGILIGATIAGAIQLIMWGGNKIYEYRKEKLTTKKILIETENLQSETEKNDSDTRLNISQTRKVDSETLSALNTTVEDLSLKYVDAIKELGSQKIIQNEMRRELDIVKNELVLVKRENTELKNKDKITESSISRLTKENVEIKLENLELRKEVEKGQAQTKKLLSGVVQLMQQIRSIPQEPVWKLGEFEDFELK